MWTMCDKCNFFLKNSMLNCLLVVADYLVRIFQIIVFLGSYFSWLIIINCYTSLKFLKNYTHILVCLVYPKTSELIIILLLFMLLSCTRTFSTHISINIRLNSFTSTHHLSYFCRNSRYVFQIIWNRVKLFSRTKIILIIIIF